MLNNYIALLPELVLFLGLICMRLVKLMRKNNTPKTFYTLSRFFLFFGAVFTAIFYNQNVTGYLYNNLFTTLFKILIYIFTFIWGYLSLKRFTSKNMPSFNFYNAVLFNTLCFSVAISTNNLLILFFGLSLGFWTSINLIKMEKEPYELNGNGVYSAFSFLFILAFACGVGIFYHYTKSFDYDAIERALAVKSLLIWQYYLAFSLIMCSILYMMSVAPFHFWFANAVGNSILPVAGYITIIPIFAYFSCMVNVIVNAFYPILGWFNIAFMCFGIFSIFIGAIGANSESNLRRIFAYSGLYYIGVTILALFPINDNNLVSAFIYLLVYIVAFCGIYTIFYGYRSRGDYLTELEDIKGIATQRPFLSVALLIFMISLIGTPPLLGFLGKLSVINSMIVGKEFVLVGAILVAMLILVYAYLKIITVVYFEARNKSFDEVDKGVYICMLINIILILIAIINPKYLMHDVEMMLIAVFK